MLNFHDLKEIRDILKHPYYVPHQAKVDLMELLEDVLELEGKKKPGRGNGYIKKQNKK